MVTTTPAGSTERRDDVTRPAGPRTSPKDGGDALYLAPANVEPHMERRICKHGNAKRLGICPDCDHERGIKRQRQADRAAFKARINAILGKAR